MKQYIKLQRIPYEEPYHLELMVHCSNGHLSCQFEYYCNASDLSDIVIGLSKIIDKETKEFIYEIGSENPERRFAYYLKIRFFRIEKTRKMGIQIKFNNNKKHLEKEIIEFGIQTDTTGINRFIEAMGLFSKLSTKTMFWKENI